MTIEFDVPSEMYEVTQAVLDSNFLHVAFKNKSIPCGDGCDYQLNVHELNQIDDIINGELEFNDFKPSTQLDYPLNLVAKLIENGNRLELPTSYRFDKKDYAVVKRICIKAGGKYKKNGFEFVEPAQIILFRILSGQDYNLKKKYQAFFTPDKLADRVVQMAELENHHSILEPSAGNGSLIRAARRLLGADKIIYCYEKSELNRNELAKFDLVNILGNDFIAEHEKKIVPTFDRIVANPPFSKNQDIQHIRAMYDFLKDDGILVSIASVHWEHSTNKKEMEFKDFLLRTAADVIWLPAGEFKESGTNVKTCIIKIRKNARA